MKIKLKPASVYINWAAYDELSDKVELTETIAMRQLDEMIRLRKCGAQFDYYVMDAFWYAPDGGYREWRRPHWSQGPDAWLKKCLAHDIKPGLWFSGNSLYQLKPIPEWKDSHDAATGGLCLFHGGFRAHWMETVRQWYARGVRLCKLDFFQFEAAPEVIRNIYTPLEILEHNKTALRQALQQLRMECPEIVFIGYNGLEESNTQLSTDRPYCRTLDLRWLEAFDALYCGDPRPADVPCANFWRSKDIYSDDRVRVYERNGAPLSRIDNCGFMVGTTGTCYHRGKEAWKGTFLLSLARGGWINTYYGSLELLDEQDGEWIAKAQSLFMPLQEFGQFDTFGDMPGSEQPYGFIAKGAEGSVITAVNPSQHEAELALPEYTGTARVLFADSGYEPQLTDQGIRIGSEQMVVLGTGLYADEKNDLGRPTDIQIPYAIEPMAAEFKSQDPKTLTAEIEAPQEGHLRIILRQFDSQGYALRTTGGCAPEGITLGNILRIDVSQGGKDIPTKVPYDKAIWTGLSWAAIELNTADLLPGTPIQIRCHSTETKTIQLKSEIYSVMYDATGEKR